MSTSTARAWMIGLSAVHVVVFVVWFVQLLGEQSQQCEITCGNLLIDLALLVAVPTSWIVAVATSIGVFLTHRELRRLCVVSWCALALTPVAFFGTSFVLNHVIS